MTRQKNSNNKIRIKIWYVNILKEGEIIKKNKSILTIILNKKNKRKKNGTKSKKNSTENKIKKQIQFYKLILDIIIHLKGKTNKYYILFFYKEKKTMVLLIG